MGVYVCKDSENRGQKQILRFIVSDAVFRPPFPAATSRARCRIVALCIAGSVRGRNRGLCARCCRPQGAMPPTHRRIVSAARRIVRLHSGGNRQPGDGLCPNVRKRRKCVVPTARVLPGCIRAASLHPARPYATNVRTCVVLRGRRYHGRLQHCKRSPERPLSGTSAAIKSAWRRRTCRSDTPLRGRRGRRSLSGRSRRRPPPSSTAWSRAGGSW